MPDMELHGQAMLDYLNDDADAKCTLRRDDGIAYPPMYAEQFFYPDWLPEIDRMFKINYLLSFFQKSLPG